MRDLFVTVQGSKVTGVYADDWESAYDQADVERGGVYRIGLVQTDELGVGDVERLVQFDKEEVGAYPDLITVIRRLEETVNSLDALNEEDRTAVRKEAWRRWQDQSDKPSRRVLWNGLRTLL